MLFYEHQVAAFIRLLFDAWQVAMFFFLRTIACCFQEKKMLESDESEPNSWAAKTKQRVDIRGKLQSLVLTPCGFVTGDAQYILNL